MKNDISKIFDEYNQNNAFSGVFSVRGAEGVLFERACGHRNRAENLPNEISTAFGIASGTKLFTGLAACRLMDEGKLRITDKVWDILPHDLQRIDKDVTVYHLLTHTSGVGDYIDEELPDSGEELLALYRRYPVYLWNNLSYYLPMIHGLPAKYKPGERYGYSNAGFVLLGLVIEAASGVHYQEYVTRNIIAPCGLAHTGFYRMDRLPYNTAYGYMHDEATGEWHTNIFSMPAVGGADGGLFTCAPDLDALWRAIFSGRVLSGATQAEWMAPRVKTGEAEGRFYGLGVYQYRAAETEAYCAVGGDFGVDFFTAYFPKYKITASALGNTEMNTWPLFNRLEALLM